MATGRRIPREKATAALTALLETTCAGGTHAGCVTAVYVFGSYTRGALTVGDVDVDIEYDAKLDPAVEREVLDSLVVGRDWNTPFRKALKPARALQVLFNRLEILAEPVLVYDRGDTFDDALARVEAIAPDSEAGRAERDPVHPAVEPVAGDLARPSRILLTELLKAGLLEIEIVDLPPTSPPNGLASACTWPPPDDASTSTTSGSPPPPPPTGCPWSPRTTTSPRCTVSPASTSSASDHSSAVPQSTDADRREEPRPGRRGGLYDHARRIVASDFPRPPALTRSHGQVLACVKAAAGVVEEALDEQGVGGGAGFADASWFHGDGPGQA